jgi:hypothetical protein
MYIVESISADSKQKQSLLLANGTTLEVEMEYRPLQSGWFFRKITYGDFVIENMRICTSPNMLHQYKNQIPFGIAVTTTGRGEPTQQQDFQSGRSVMYILTEEETAEYTAYLNGG